MLGIVEIPHLRWRLRRQLLHEEQLEAATLAPSPRQADAGEGTGGEEAAGPIAAAAGAARVAGWLARPLTPSLPPSLKVAARLLKGKYNTWFETPFLGYLSSGVALKWKSG